MNRKKFLILVGGSIALGGVTEKEDVTYLNNEETDFIHYNPNSSKEHKWLNQQTVEQNTILL